MLQRLESAEGWLSMVTQLSLRTKPSHAPEDQSKKLYAPSAVACGKGVGCSAIPRPVSMLRFAKRSLAIWFYFAPGPARPRSYRCPYPGLDISTHLPYCADRLRKYTTAQFRMKVCHSLVVMGLGVSNHYRSIAANAWTANQNSNGWKKKKRKNKNKQRSKFGPKGKATKSLSRKQAYDLYINSWAWKAKREELFRSRPRHCERCSYAGPVDVHHLHYENLGAEPLSDLQILCRECHEREHIVRPKNSFTDKKSYEKWLNSLDTAE